MRLKSHTQWLIAIIVISVSSFLHAQPEQESMYLQEKVQFTCDHPPTIVCPGSFESCPTASTDPANTGYAIGFPANPFCSPPVVTYTD